MESGDEAAPVSLVTAGCTVTEPDDVRAVLV